MDQSDHQAFDGLKGPSSFERIKGPPNFKWIKWGGGIELSIDLWDLKRLEGPLSLKCLLFGNCLILFRGNLF